MDFELTEEQKMLKDMAYKFARAKFTPYRSPATSRRIHAGDPEEGGGPGSRRRMGPRGVRRRGAGSSGIPSSPRSSPRWTWGSA